MAHKKDVEAWHQKDVERTKAEMEGIRSGIVETKANY